MPAHRASATELVEAGWRSTVYDVAVDGWWNWLFLICSTGKASDPRKEHGMAVRVGRAILRIA